MHDGVPVHFLIEVHNYLHVTYSGRWIGCGGPIAWLPCFPDLNPLDFFFWSHLKLFVCEMSVATVEDLPPRIVVASADIASTSGL
ncbi:uncharacterized protein TNCV_1702791 [Trichonephila clavipes]|nr:uncharacterized protein TNCV_1702791 [Trichonephila clavipes]